MLKSSEARSGMGRRQLLYLTFAGGIGLILLVIGTYQLLHFKIL